MSERGKLVKDIIEIYRIRVIKRNTKSPEKQLDCKWVSVKGAPGVSKAKEMAVAMADDFWPCGGSFYWEASIAQALKRRIK